SLKHLFAFSLAGSRPLHCCCLPCKVKVKAEIVPSDGERVSFITDSYMDASTKSCPAGRVFKDRKESNPFLHWSRQNKRQTRHCQGGRLSSHLVRARGSVRCRHRLNRSATSRKLVALQPDRRARNFLP